MSKRKRQDGISAAPPVLFKCFHCGKYIHGDDGYYQIMHYKQHPIKASYKEFHEECFSEIAGEKYV